MNLTTEKQGFVYLIEATDTKVVKIGFSLTPQKRLAQLQTGSSVPLRMIGAWPGSLDLERKLHERLSAFRVAGEWFYLPAESGISIEVLITEMSEAKVVTPSEPLTDMRGTGIRNRLVRTDDDWITAALEAEAGCIMVNDSLRAIAQAKPELAEILRAIINNATMALDRTTACRRYLMSKEA